MLKLVLSVAAIGIAVPAAATAVPAAPAPPTVVVAAAPDIALANTRAHLQQFQAIATANGGTRRSNTAGYTASQTYVFNQLSAAGFSVARQACAAGCTSGAGPNVIADWPGGDPATVYMFGAHLDSVAAGPGVNDNGSGSATVLELALTLARTDPTMLNGVPTSGVAAGASADKTSAQVAKWGGSAGDYDPCYHRSCDTFPANISDTVLDRSGDAAAHALWTLAVSTP